jgi:hypothetical protein
VSSTSIVVVRQQLPTVTLTANATNTSCHSHFNNVLGNASDRRANRVRARNAAGWNRHLQRYQCEHFNYKFGGAGTYTLTGVVTDSNGNSATASTTVFVTP